MSAYVSIRQHTSAYVSIRTSAYVSIRQHTSAYASIRQHTSARCPFISIRQHTQACVSIRQHTSTYVSKVPVTPPCICQHMSAYASICQHTSVTRRFICLPSNLPASPYDVTSMYVCVSCVCVCHVCVCVLCVLLCASELCVCVCHYTHNTHREHPLQTNIRTPARIPAYVSIRQHTSGIRQQTSAYKHLRASHPTLL
jgi:hypothetical protein